jgi:hypothetical protein
MQTERLTLWDYRYVIIILLALIIAFIFLMSTVQAQPALKFYSIENKSICETAVSSLNNTPYFYSVKTILFFQREKGGILGDWYYNTIRIYSGCNIETLETLRHELAHQCQYIRHDSLYNMLNHIGQWEDCNR